MSTDPNHDREDVAPAYARYPPLNVPLARVSSHEDPRNPRVPSHEDPRNPRSIAPTRGSDGREDPRSAHPSAAAWERPPPPPNQRVAERSAPREDFADAYSHPQQQQLQQQQSWSSRGENGATPAASRYMDEGDHDSYGGPPRQQQQVQLHQQQQYQQQQQRQWQRRESHDDGDEAAWEQPGRHHYPPARRAPTVRPEQHPAHMQYGQSSRWQDEAEPHGSPRGGYTGVVDGGGVGGQRRMPHRGPPRGYADMPPHHEPRGDESYDDGDFDDDVPGAKRRRPLPPHPAGSGSARGAPPPGARAAWAEDAGYTLPPAPSIRGEDFEKEVVKAAALLVAEREIRNREEARKGETRDWPEEADPSRRYEERKVTPRAHRDTESHGAPAHGALLHGGSVHGAAPVRSSTEGRRRPLSVEGADRRGQRNGDSRERLERDARSGGRGGGSARGGGSGRGGSSGRGSSGGAADRSSWKDGAADETWGGNKRARGDGSPGGGRAGGGRTEDRQVKGRGEGKGEGRRTSGEKFSADGPKTKPARRADSRERHLAESRGDRHRDDSKGKYRDEIRAKGDGRPLSAGGSKDKKRHPASTLDSEAPTSWERNGKRADLNAEDESRAWHAGAGGDADSSRDGGHNTANFKSRDMGSGDTGYFVHVGGISFSTTFTTLAKRFAAFGDVNGFKVIFNQVTCRSADTDGGGSGGDRGHKSARRYEGRGAKDEANKAAVVTASTGFAFISFEDERGMEKAIAGMNDQMLDGHVLKVRQQEDQVH